MPWTAASLFPQFNQMLTPPRTVQVDPGSAPATQPQRAGQTAYAGPGGTKSLPKAPNAGNAGKGAKKALMSQVLNDPSLMGTGPTPKAPGMTQAGPSIVNNPANLGTGSNINIPPWLNNPQGILGQSLLPYSDLLNRILQPAAPQQVIPPDVAAAYSNAANAAAQRAQAQTQAINAALALPSQAAALGMRAAALSPISLGGLPTGLGYRDPTQALRDQIFQTNAAMLPGSGINQLASSAARGGGWVPALPGF